MTDRHKKNRDEEEIDNDYIEESEPLALTTAKKGKKKKPALFGKKKNNFEPEDDEDDPDYNDSFFDEF